MKTKILLGAAFVALAASAPAVLQAQQLPAPVIAVVNTDQIFTTCTQCAAANTQLQAQANALQARVQTLQQQIQAEGNALEPLVQNQSPEQIRANAALATRIQNFQTGPRRWIRTHSRRSSTPGSTGVRNLAFSIDMK